MVHGKGSLLGKMPGDDWQKFANLRCLYGFMWAHPGKKLLFMGGEFGQWREWNHDASLDWHLLDDAAHRGLQRWSRDLNRLYRAQPALHELDASRRVSTGSTHDDAATACSPSAALRRAAIATCSSRVQLHAGAARRLPHRRAAAGRCTRVSTPTPQSTAAATWATARRVSTAEPCRCTAGAQSLALTLPPLATSCCRAGMCRNGAGSGSRDRPARLSAGRDLGRRAASTSRCFSAHAERVELCLFDAAAGTRCARMHAAANAPTSLARLPAGRGGRARSTATACTAPEPASGHRFNPHKLLLDPYAQALVGTLAGATRTSAIASARSAATCSFDRRDNAAGMPKCGRGRHAFDWGDDRPPRTPWTDTVLYELHVRGYTMRHPGVPAQLRGTYAGLAAPRGRSRI